MPIAIGGNLIHVNKYLTNLSTITPQEGAVADAIMPPFKVNQDSDIYSEYSRTGTHRVLNDQLAKGQQPRQIETGYIQHTYTCDRYALSDYVYDQDVRNADNPIRPFEDSMFSLRTLHQLARERRVLNQAFSALVPGAAVAGGAWNVAAGTPIRDVTDAMAAIWAATQCKANAIVIPMSRAITLSRCTEWAAQFTFTETGFRGGLFNIFTGFENFGLEVFISGLCGLTTNQGTASDPDDFEGLLGNRALVFVRKPSPTLRTRCFGFSPYTKQNEVWTGRGSFEEKIGATYTKIESQIDELLIDVNCGYQITGI